MQPLNNLDAQKLEIRSSKYHDAFSSAVKEKEKMSLTIGAIGSQYTSKKSGGNAIIN